MDLREAIEKYKQLKIPSLSTTCRNAKQYSKTYLLIAIILFLVFIYLIQQIPHWQVAQFGITNPKDLADAENSYRATLAQILGGIAVGIGIYFAWGNLKVAQATLESNQKTAEKNLEIAQEGQITERFTRAVDQLGAIDQYGKPVTEIRLGGIYALERIASESKKDYWPIMEILTAYVRKNSSFKVAENIKNSSIPMNLQANESTKSEISEIDEVPLDIQAILTVIGRRKHFIDYEISGRLNLKETYLPKAYLENAHLEGADLRRADLRKADLGSVHLQGADLMEANLEEAYIPKAYLMEANLKKANCKKATFNRKTNLYRADLEGANLEEAYLRKAYLERAYLKDANIKKARLHSAFLEGADLRRADLKEAILQGAYLKGADLEGAILERADLGRGAIKIGEGARLQEANLKGTNLRGTDFEMVNLQGANLEGADLKEAKNLTIDQLSKAKTLYDAKLDEEIEKPLREKCPALFEKPKNEFLVFR